MSPKKLSGYREAFRTFIGIEVLPRNYSEKVLATGGAIISIMAVAVISVSVMGADAALLIVASMGATSMLLFSLPHAAVSQPWPVFAGQVVSALIGVFVSRHITDPLLAAPLAVGLCTLVMFLGRCLHPPGAATALTAVFATGGLREMGYSFALAPVALNVMTLLVIAFLFNAPFAWRRYPAGWRRKEQTDGDPEISESPLTHDEFINAVRDLDTFIDVSEDDLLELHRLMASYETSRRH